MNIRKIKESANRLLHSQLFWIKVCAIGIWLLVIQNFFGVRRVYVVGGRIDADVTGKVDVTGEVDANVSGSVDVDNTVSVEVENTVRTWNW